jgi:hypothetical protein
METANEAKRLAPLEPKAARLEEAVHAAHAELERVQREVTSHQSSIRQAKPLSFCGCAAAETAKQCSICLLLNGWKCWGVISPFRQGFTLPL